MYKIIAEIAENNSKLHKEAVLVREAEAGNVRLFDGLQYCFDNMITFGVKQIPEAVVDGGGLEWNAFMVLANSLYAREVTGNAARDAIVSAMTLATMDQWNGWYRRILIKDMRAGFSVVTVNKALKKGGRSDLVIPVFECQLAHDAANTPEKLVGNKLIEVKLDGVRVLTVVYPDGKVDMLSRNGKELGNFPVIQEQFSKVASKLTEPMVFDGEVMSNNFQDLMRQIQRKNDVQTDDAILYLFDWLSLEEFTLGRCNIKQQFRSENLQAFVKKAKMANVKTVQNEFVDLDSAEGQLRFKQINAKAIAGGYEGIMVKDPYAAYECKRVNSWLKIKPTISADLTVIGLEEGTGKNLGSLGAIVCEGTDQNRFIKVNVGSGFTDKQRVDFWNNKDKVIGQTVEILADAVTKSQEADSFYSLRFPRFLRFRDDK